MDNTWRNLRFTRHAIDMAIARIDGIDTPEQAKDLMRSEYIASKITYASKRHPEQDKIQGDHICMAYERANHKIVTLFISGHVTVTPV